MSKNKPQKRQMNNSYLKDKKCEGSVVRAVSFSCPVYSAAINSLGEAVSFSKYVNLALKRQLIADGIEIK